MQLLQIVEQTENREILKTHLEIKRLYFLAMQAHLEYEELKRRKKENELREKESRKKRDSQKKQAQELCKKIMELEDTLQKALGNDTSDTKTTKKILQEIEQAIKQQSNLNLMLHNTKCDLKSNQKWNESHEKEIGKKQEKLSQTLLALKEKLIQAKQNLNIDAITQALKSSDFIIDLDDKIKANIIEWMIFLINQEIYMLTEINKYASYLLTNPTASWEYQLKAFGKIEKWDSFLNLLEKIIIEYITSLKTSRHTNSTSLTADLNYIITGYNIFLKCNEGSLQEADRLLFLQNQNTLKKAAEEKHFPLPFITQNTTRKELICHLYEYLNQLVGTQQTQNIKKYKSAYSV